MNWRIGLVLALAFGCNRSDPLYCDLTHPCTDPSRPFCDLNGLYDTHSRTCIGRTVASDAGADGALTLCVVDTDCALDHPICNHDNGVCRTCQGDPECMGRSPTTPYCVSSGCSACRSSADCTTATSPICDANACRACRTDAECPSGICNVGTGTCVDGANILYVTPSGNDSNPGTSQMPLATIQGAIGHIDNTKAFIHVAQGDYQESVSIPGGGSSGKTVSIIGADGAVLKSDDSDEAAILVAGTSNVTLRGLTIQDAHGNQNADGIRCSDPSATPVLSVANCTIKNNAAQGIDVNSCNVTLSGNTISNNTGGGVSASSSTLSLDRNTISNNTGGGVSLSGSDFTITNNFFVYNGGATSTLGGIFMTGSGTQNRRIFFNNTVVGNQANSATPRAIGCNPALELVNTIIWGHSGSNIITACTFTNSDVQGGAPGTGNLDLDPLFTDADDTDVPNNNYHLQPSSPCKDMGTPNGAPDHDFDGDPRPRGSGFDIGADEL